MLGEPISMLVPQVVGFRLTGGLPAGATATDLVLTVTEILRGVGVVGKFVEFFGHGLVGLPLADRATIANMAPECGSTCNFFPVDDETLRYLDLTARPAERIGLVEAYARGAASVPRSGRRADLLAGRRARSRRRRAEPRRAPPARRIASRSRVREAHSSRRCRASASATGTETHDEAVAESFPASDPPADIEPGHESRAVGTESTVRRRCRLPRRLRSTLDGETFELEHGAVVIAAITSCTNTSNPAVMVGAGLLARRAVERGLAGKPWVKSSLAPGSKVVTEYLARAGLTPYLDAARLQPRRLRLHDLHRELRPAARADLGRRSRRATSSSAPCCPGTATSRLESTRRSRRTTSPLPRSSSPTRSRVGWTSTCSTEPLGQDGDGNRRLPARPLAEPAGDRRDDRRVAPPGHVRVGRTRTSSPATSAGTRCEFRPATSTRWERVVDVRPAAAVLRRHAGRAAGRRRPRRAPAASSWSATA